MPRDLGAQLLGLAAVLDCRLSQVLDQPVTLSQLAASLDQIPVERGNKRSEDTQGALILERYLVKRRLGRLVSVVGAKQL